MVTALLSGEVDFSLEQISVALPLIKGGKTVPIAVTSRTRFPLLPDVPTLDESGYKGFEAVTWIGFFVPAGTPRHVVERLGGALEAALREPTVVKRFTDLGSQTRPMTPQVFSAYVSAEDAKWRPVIQKAHIKAE